MTDADRDRIISNDYADLLIEYNGNMGVFNNYPSGSVNIINRDYAILHIPEYNMTPDSISKYGYFSIPTCFGLLSSSPSSQNTSYKVNKLNDNADYELTGEGVLIGFIDTGIDYKNQVFINSAHKSKIISIWDQTIESGNTYPEGFFYGTEYSQDQINQALSSTDPLSIVPSMDEQGHGTILASTAAASPAAENGFRGIAPNADFVIVKLKTAKPYLKKFFAIPEDAICYQENDIIMGIKYLTQVAQRLNRPLVISLGICTSQSDHTGNRVISRYLAMTSEMVGTSVIVSAGNEGNRRHHYYGEIINPISSDNVFLNVGKNEQGFSLQFRGTSPNRFWIDVYSPSGELISNVPPIPNNTMVFSFQDTTIVADSQIQEPLTNTQFIVFRIQNPMAGIWRFYIHGESGDLPMQFHFWLPIQDFIRKSTFFFKSNNNTTITAPGNQTSLICTTAYDQNNGALYYLASKGFTISNYPKPDLTAPGVNVFSTALGNQFVNSTCTSIAAAYTAGVAAMLMEWGIIRGNYPKMNNIIIKKILTQGATRKAELVYPNPDWGYGILEISKIINLLNRILNDTKI